jgi:hypothetical protein
LGSRNALTAAVDSRPALTALTARLEDAEIEAIRV